MSHAVVVDPRKPRQPILALQREDCLSALFNICEVEQEGGQALAALRPVALWVERVVMGVILLPQLIPQHIERLAMLPGHHSHLCYLLLQGVEDTRRIFFSVQKRPLAGTDIFGVLRGISFA
eukprot:CAMPEP_0198217208 /NCGR_PEP_ID=MMETSP1445-20131203/62221_1 /TAXON_ID=36898 /ORGANISM="Pyramimonas sp., Strain CCMP2087" /LENGTH=121 /DNA_ID=CAMNT_0043893791 /DNA_START=308 /DNA_END=672 /DNA_ORIENTATION=+